MDVSAWIEKFGVCHAYHPGLARAIGVKESIFLRQLVYWTPKAANRRGEGWIHKTVEKMEIETGLRYKEQIRVRASLMSRGLLEETYDRTEHRLYFRVIPEGIEKIQIEYLTDGHIPIRKMPPDKREDTTCQKVSSYKEQEITHEITQQSKPSAEKRSADSRHFEIREHIKSEYTRCTGLDPAPWSGRDAKSLDNFLKANSQWTVEKIKELVGNRFDSEVNQADPAYTWLPQLQKFVFPLDNWGKPIRRGAPFSEGMIYAGPSGAEPPCRLTASGAHRMDDSPPLSRSEQRLLRGRTNLAIAVAEISSSPLTRNDSEANEGDREERFGIAEFAAMIRGIEPIKRMP